MKVLFKLAFAMMLVAPSLCFVSCKDSSSEGSSNPDDPTNPNNGKVFTSVEQKEKLESVALEVANLIPASDFQNIHDLALYIRETYIDGYDWDNVEDWARDIFESYVPKISSDEYSEEYGGYGYTYVYTYVYRNYKGTIAASNFKGHFTANNGRWSKSDASDLQFIFKDKVGNNCVLKLETSGSEKNVHVGNIEEYDLDSEYDWNNNWSHYTSYEDTYDMTIKIPEHVMVTLTQGGSTVVKADTYIDLKSLSGEEFNFARNSLTVKTNVELNNGYVVNVSEVAYTANSKASASCSVSKNGRTIISTSVAADPSDLPDYNLSAFVSDPDEDVWEKANGKNAYVKVDVLGKVQIQGTLANARSYVDNLNAADDNDENESKFKQYINAANSLTDINLYYDNTSAKQAKFVLEPMEKKYYYYGEYRYWEAEPTIQFNDGSSYSLDVYFNENDFKRVVDAYEKLGNNYEDMFEDVIE